jgi:hypothetical protein
MATTNKRTALVCEGLAAMLAAVLSPLRWGMQT